MPEAMRLQRFLARAGVGSRRVCESYIEQGLVRVNGQVATLGMSVVPGEDAVEFEGAPVQVPAEAVVILLNKPAGYLTSTADPHHSKLVTSLVPAGEYPGLFPVGRLDLDTEGLLLLTNDGELGHALMHPRFEVEKRYHATLCGVPSEEALQQLREGVVLGDGPCAPAKVELLSTSEDGKHATVSIEIHEGRKRQVKRMCSAVGHQVEYLERVAYAGLGLEGVARGEWRLLESAEVAALRACVK